MAHGDARLLHGSGGQGGKSDDIPCGVNVWNLGLVVFVDLQQPSLVGGEPDFFETEGFRCALTTGGREDRVKRCLAIIFEDNMQFRIRADGFHRVPEHQPHTHSFHGPLQGLRDFRI